MKYIVELWKCETYEFDVPDEDGYSISIDDAIEHSCELADDDGDSFTQPVDAIKVYEIDDNGDSILVKEI